ncbi:MAG TPA: hypothetical protein VGG74_07285 [Kofleriaceae bacterium]
MGMERMTSSGRQLAFLIAVLIAFALPKHVDCGHPGVTCGVQRGKELCTRYEVEPWGFYLLENVFGRDIGFAYSSGDDCH